MFNNLYTSEKSSKKNEVFLEAGSPSLRYFERLADNKIISLDKTNFNTKINTKIWNFNTENNKSIYIQLFLRYLLLKKFSLKFNQKLETRNFLFFNFINFTLLNNKNKFFLVSNFLNLKIHDYKQYLKNDITNNKIKFSNLLATRTKQMNYTRKKNIYIQKNRSAAKQTLWSD